MSSFTDPKNPNRLPNILAHDENGERLKSMRPKQVYTHPSQVPNARYIKYDYQKIVEVIIAGVQLKTEKDILSKESFEKWRPRSAKFVK
jgi:hypothetical protein